MDTGLKKYKRDTLKRVIAVLLCLVCMCTMTVHMLTAIDSAKSVDLVYVNFADAINYKLLGRTGSEWKYDTFRNGYTVLLSYLQQKSQHYGNGTEEDYEKRLEEHKKDLEDEVERYRKGMIFKASNDLWHFNNLCSYGILEITATSVDKVEDSAIEDWEEMSTGSSFGQYRSDVGFLQEPLLPASVSEKFRKSEYDGVFYISRPTIVTYDEEIQSRYYAGYYAFKINTDKLRKALIENDEVVTFYSSYDAFREAYLQLENDIAKHAGSVKYYIRDRGGNMITNISSLDKKATADELKKVFKNYGIYSYGKNGSIYLSDGMYYSNTYIDWFENNYAGDSVVYETTTLPEVHTTVYTTAVAVSGYNDVTAPPEPTTMKPAVTEEAVSSYSDFVLYIAFDKNAEYESCHFANVETNVSTAYMLIKDCFLSCAFFGLIVLACVIYLASITGKRKGSSEIHLYKADKIFLEIRTAVAGALAFATGFGIIYFVQLYVDSNMKKTIGFCTAALMCLLFLVCLDLLLYYVRHIRNHSLLKSISIIWLGSKIHGYIGTVKKFVNERLLYTENLKRTVFIRTAAVVAINIIAGFIALLYIEARGWGMGILIIFALFLFDLWILYRGVRFAGGVDKLFAVVKEMHEGNTDIEINKNALPDYLYLPAENLQSLNEGIKAAVEEAVKQEKTKTELITNVSHDLKTPLTSIINYVDLLKKCDISDETAVSYLQVLSEKSDRLKVLIEDLVEASKASAGAINVDFVSVSLKELINQLMGEFEDSFEEKKLQVVMNIPGNDVIVRADSKQIYRVMENLFVNVRKYALESTRVYITIEEKGNKGTVNIKNISSAPLNISADELKERFVRGEQSRTTEGNGLGLSIAENLCILQKGSLDIEINGDLFSVTVVMEKDS